VRRPDATTRHIATSRCLAPSRLHVRERAAQGHRARDGRLPQGPCEPNQCGDEDPKSSGAWDFGNADPDVAASVDGVMSFVRNDVEQPPSTIGTNVRASSSLRLIVRLPFLVLCHPIHSGRAGGSTVSTIIRWW